MQTPSTLLSAMVVFAIIIFLCIFILVMMYLKGRCSSGEIIKYLIHITPENDIYIIPPRKQVRDEAKFYKTMGREGCYPLYKGPYTNLQDAYKAITTYDSKEG